MYAMAGSDGARFFNSGTSVEWVEFDKDFYKRVSKDLNIIRLRDQNLREAYHPTNCLSGSSAESAQFQSW